MGRVKVYGASDDLIEVAGDLEEEFNVGDEPTLLHFSDGTVLEVTYREDALWHIERRVVGSAGYERRDATDEDDDYSDTVWLDGVSWVKVGR